MARPDDFKLIRQIVAAGGHKHMTDELDRGKYQRLVELGWLKASMTNASEVSYRVRTRPSSRLALLKVRIPPKWRARLRAKSLGLLTDSLNDFQDLAKSPSANAEERPLDTKDQEQVMKLNEAQIGKTLAQFQAQVLAEDHPAAAQFCELFGHHTFFLDARGLHVLELLEVPGMEAQNGEMVSLADWSDADFTKLTTHQPEPTGVVIRLQEVQH